MPYHKVKDHSSCTSGEIAVVKDRTGEVMGCHESDEKANRQLAALHAAEKDEASVQTAVPTPTPAVHGFSDRYETLHNRSLAWFEILIEDFTHEMERSPYEYDQGQVIAVDYDSFYDLVVGAREALKALKGNEGL